MADSGQWRNLERLLRAKFPNARVSSSYRPGSKTRSGNNSYHGRGDAIDIVPPSMTIFNWIAATYPGSAEIIYTPAGGRQINNGKPHVYSAAVARDHFDHIHWAMPAGTGGSPNFQNADFGNPVTGAVDTFNGLIAFGNFVTNPTMWARVGVAIAGLLVLVLGLIRLVGPAALRNLPQVKGLRDVGLS